MQDDIRLECTCGTVPVIPELGHDSTVAGIAGH